MKNKKIYYFAYGSNLSYVQMLKRCPHSKYVGRARINNHRVICTGYSSKWHGGVATLLKDQTRVVWGVVYILDEDCLLKLDGYEGVKYKFYQRKKVICHFANGRKKLAITYIREPKKIHHSSKKYKSVILSGAAYYNLPSDYIQQLKSEL